MPGFARALVGTKTELDAIRFYEGELAYARDQSRLYVANVPAGQTSALGSVALDDEYEGLPDPHRSTHISGGSDAFLSTDLLEAHVKRILESGGQVMTVGAVADGQILQRSGTALIGVTSAADVFAPDTILDSTATHTEINAALTAFGAGGGWLHLKSGTYAIGGLITIPIVGDIKITGAGDSTVLQKSAGAFDMIEIPAGFTQHLSILDMRIDPNAVLPAGQQAILISATGAVDTIHLERMHFESSGAAPGNTTFYIADSVAQDHRINLIDCKFLDGTGDHRNISISSHKFRMTRGILTARPNVAGDDSLVTGVEINDVLTSRGNRPKIVANTFTVNGTCILVPGLATFVDAVIEGNTFNGGAGGVAIDIGNTSQANIALIDNTFLNATDGVLKLERNDLLSQVIGNKASGVGGAAHGFEFLGDGSEHVEIHNNGVRGSSTGIAYRIAVDNSLGNGNYANGFSGGGIVEVGTADDNNFNGNTLENNGANQLVLIGPNSRHRGTTFL